MREVNLLSIVVPCHNEEEALPNTHQQLTSVMESLTAEGKCRDYELIYVDNGSTDNTLELLEKIFAGSSRVKIIALRRNFGFQGSISAGLFYAKGDAVVTIDADLQDPPEKVSQMIVYYNKGYDLVLGVRNDRSCDSFIKRFFAENFYRLVKLMGLEIVHNHGDFRLMARALVDEFNSLGERNRFIRAMVLKLDSRYAEVSYSRQPRRKGRSKFNPASLFSFSLDAITSFSYLPLRLVSILGIFMCFVTAGGIIWALWAKFYLNVIPGWASTILPIFALGGIQFLILGVIGEYIGRLYIEVKQRPLFVVRKKYSHSELKEIEAVE